MVLADDVAVVVVVVAVPGELCAMQRAEKQQVSATMARIRIFMERELEEFSTE